MKPSNRTRKQTKPYEPATTQDQLMSTIKKKKRHTQKEREKKKDLREKQAMVLDSEQKNANQEVAMELDTEKMETDKQGKKNVKNCNQ